MSDDYMEYVRIETQNPAEIMEEYKRIVNEAFQKSESGYSRRWSEMLEWGLRAHWLEEIKGEYFACIEWTLVRYVDKEKFLGIEDEQ